MPSTAIGFYATFEDVNGQPCTIEQFRAELIKYDRQSVVSLCSYLNFLFQWLEFEKDARYFSRLVASAFPPLWAGQFLAEGRPPFHRRQCLFLAKEAIRYCPEVGIDPRTQSHLGDFGRVLLMASDVLYKDAPATNLSEGRSKVLVNFLPSLEYFGAPFKDSIVRSTKMAEEINSITPGKNKIDIAGRYKEGLGIDLALFRSFCSAVLTKFINSKFRKKFVKSNGEVDWVACSESMKFNAGWFGNALPADSLAACLGQTASDFSSLKQAAASSFGDEDFTIFRNTPVVRLGEEYLLLDLGFLIDKIETGPFWYVHSTLSSSELKFDSLSTWGEIVEKYANWLISVSVNSAQNQWFPNPVFAGTTDEISDTVVLCRSSAVFIECKGGFFNAKAKYSGNAEELRSEIQKKLVQNTKGKPKGIQQLANSITKLFGTQSTVAVDEFRVAEIKTVFPVLLVRDDIGAAPVINLELASQFDSLINRKDLTVEVKPLIVISLKVLEFVCRYLDIVSLSAILSARIAADPSLYLPFWITPNSVIDSIGNKDNSAINEEFWKCIVEVAKLLFPGQKLPGTKLTQ